MSAPVTRARDLLKAVRVTLALAGLVSLIAGIVILAWPKETAAFLTGIIAAQLVIVGLVYVGLGIFSRDRGGWSRLGHIILGVLYVVAGVVVFANIGAATAMLAVIIAVIVGVSWILDGIVALSFLRDAASKPWTIFYSILSILGGLVLAFSPLYGALVLWWLIGATLVALGVLQLVRALVLGRAARAVTAATASPVSEQTP